MFISCKKSVKIPTEDGKYVVFPVGYVGKCPDELKKHWYFKALVEEATITYIGDSKEVDSEEAAKIAAAKLIEESEKADRKRQIDEAKEAAKIAAEKEAEEKGLTAPDKKKLVSERQKEAVQAVLKSFKEDENINK